MVYFLWRIFFRASDLIFIDDGRKWILWSFYVILLYVSCLIYTYSIISLILANIRQFGVRLCGKSPGVENLVLHQEQRAQNRRLVTGCLKSSKANKFVARWNSMWIQQQHSYTNGWRWAHSWWILMVCEVQSA